MADLFANCLAISFVIWRINLQFPNTRGFHGSNCEVLPNLRAFMEDNVVVCHTHFDCIGWLHRVKQPIGLSSPKPGILVEANPEGDLFGEIIVFTGSLQIPRRDAAALAANVGCAVGDNVTKTTTILVVGDNDVTKLAGFSKSTKHRTAERLAAAGQPIRILRESDFQKLVEDCQKTHA